LFQKLVKCVAAFQILDQNLKWDTRASEDGLTAEDVNILNDWILIHLRLPNGILAHQSERALSGQAGPETRGVSLKVGENALLGVGAGAMDSGRDTLHLVFAVQLHFL
jgi:hypothetical protein